MNLVQSFAYFCLPRFGLLALLSPGVKANCLLVINFLVCEYECVCFGGVIVSIMMTAIFKHLGRNRRPLSMGLSVILLYSHLLLFCQKEEKQIQEVSHYRETPSAFLSHKLHWLQLPLRTFQSPVSALGYTMFMNDSPCPVYSRWLIITSSSFTLYTDYLWTIMSLIMMQSVFTEGLKQFQIFFFLKTSNWIKCFMIQKECPYSVSEEMYGKPLWKDFCVLSPGVSFSWQALHRPALHRECSRGQICRPWPLYTAYVARWRFWNTLLFLSLCEV
jgi:hypothetical protein